MASPTTYLPGKHAPALAHRLLAAHGLASDPAASNVLTAILAERFPFLCAHPLAAGGADVARGQYRNFVYDKASRTLFLNCAPGRHGLVMAALEWLHRGGPAASQATWLGLSDQLRATLDEMAESFIDRGHGLFLSSIWEHFSDDDLRCKKLTVSANFSWDVDELAVFGGYGRDEL